MDGPPLHEGNPDGAVRRWDFGPGHAGQAIYLVLDEQQEVHVVFVQWLADPRIGGRISHQLKLARLIMVTGDPIEATALGVQALDWAGTLRSGRVTHGLRELRRLAEPHTNLTEVAELRDRIRTVVAAA